MELSTQDFGDLSEAAASWVPGAELGRLREAEAAPGRAQRSRLCVLDEPETYTARLAADREKSLALRERELQQRIDEALAECTFRPAVNPGPPKYITRMAESHRALKELRLGLASREERGGSLTLRPDWRDRKSVV